MKNIYRAILCRACALLGHVHLCTLPSSLTRAPRLARNCFPYGACVKEREL